MIKKTKEEEEINDLKIQLKISEEEASDLTKELEDLEEAFEDLEAFVESQDHLIYPSNLREKLIVENLIDYIQLNGLLSIESFLKK